MLLNKKKMNNLLKKSLLLLSITPSFLFAQISQDSLKFDEKFDEVDMYYKSASKEAKEYYLEGYKYFNASQFDKSIDSYKQAIEADSLFIDAIDNLANSYRFKGDFKNSEYWFKKSINLYPKGYISHQNLAIVYLSTSRPKEAINEYSIMLDIDSKNPEGFFGKANAYIVLQDGKNVVSNAKKALSIYEKTNAPYEMDALYLIGVGYYLQNDSKSAKEYLTKSQAMGMKIPEGLKSLLD